MRTTDQWLCLWHASQQITARRAAWPFRLQFQYLSRVKDAAVTSSESPATHAVSRFEQHSVLRPVVVIVHTGGTIGAVEDVSSVHLDTDDGTAILKAFDQRITSDYAQLAGPEFPIPFDLEWESLPADQQLLSENANPATWKHLGQAVERICARYASTAASLSEPTQTYLAGIVLLHGTDTLAYSAAALSLSLRNLPCPVIITGANQPPNARSIHEQDLINSESDAWKNLLRSLQFIQAFGHRFTEVFVCFHDTVHIALNLRKVAIDRIPHPLQRELKAQEPFSYRNHGPLRQYAYRMIDGLYCNNLYPISSDIGYDILIHDRINRYRHIRQSPWPSNTLLTREEFAKGVKLISASPASLVPSNSVAMSADTTIVLIEGYSSGTFPTSANHAFHAFLQILLQNAIPVALVTKDGLIPSKPYEMSQIDGLQMPVLRLFGIVAETAVPLLSLILASIPQDLWNPTPSYDYTKLISTRHTLLADAIRKRQTEPDGILTALLGNILDENEQRTARNERLQHREVEHSRRVTELFAESRYVKLPGRKRKFSAPNRQPASRFFDASMTVFMRQHFLWLLGELVHSFDNASAGPDGLAFWNELGFAWGSQVRDTLAPPPFRGQRALFASRPTEHQEELTRSARRQTEIITSFLFTYGVADLHAQLSVSSPLDVAKRHRGGLCSVRVEARKHGRGGRNDDLLSVIGYQSEEMDFFRALRNGCRDLSKGDDCHAALAALFRQRFEHALALKVSPLDWFLIGVYKALMSGVLRDLCFDPWIYRCDRDELGEVEALRQSIAAEVHAADRHVLKFTLSYASRDTY